MRKCRRPVADVTPSDNKKESKCRRLVADVEPSTAEPSENMLQDKKERMDVAFVISEYDAPLSPLSSILFCSCGDLYIINAQVFAELFPSIAD